MYSLSIRNLKLAIISLFLLFVIWQPSLSDAKIVGDSNPYFGKLPPIYQSYVKSVMDLKAKYGTPKTKEDRKKIKKLIRDKRDQLKVTINKFNSTHPIVGSKLPYKVVGDVPYTVQYIEITKLVYSSIKFNVRVKINKDIKNAKNKIEQRINIYFAAFDKNNQFIKGTTNWATNDGWINLIAGTIYDAQGHWNANHFESMDNFKYIQIMSKDEYEKLK